MIDISLSVVSHGQLGLVQNLLKDLQALEDCRLYKIEVILTLNIPEAEDILDKKFDFELVIVRNHAPLGFGANHNAAFRQSSGRYFCVVNPDIRLDTSPFLAIMSDADKDANVIGPVVVNPSGRLEITARKFPTPWKILLKAFGRVPASDYPELVNKQEVDWIGGMFMFFSRHTFGLLGGFDDRYFLYYEDVDLCARAWLAGLKVVVIPKAVVIHDAQRSSHRDFKYLRWHLTSMGRFFMSSVFIRVVRIRKNGAF